MTKDLENAIRAMDERQRGKPRTITPPVIPPRPVLRSIVFAQLCWRGECIREIPQFRRIDILPTNEYPLGRKGHTLVSVWNTCAEEHTVGMCILDGDVAIDPLDAALMHQAITQYKDDIHLAHVKIWPKSTGLSDWTWAERKWGTNTVEEWQKLRADVDTMSFGFTYIPRRLIEQCIREGMHTWVYPNVDFNVGRVAREMKIKFRIVEGAYPKHVNF